MTFLIAAFIYLICWAAASFLVYILFTIDFPEPKEKGRNLRTSIVFGFGGPISLLVSLLLVFIEWPFKKN